MHDITDTKYDTQVRLEKKMRASSMASFIRKAESAVKLGEFGSHDVGSYLIRNYVDLYTKYVMEDYLKAVDGKAGTRGGSVPAYARIIGHMGIDKAAWIAFNQIIGLIHISDSGSVQFSETDSVIQAPLLASATQVGNALRAEYMLEHFKSLKPDYFNQMWKDFDRKGYTKYRRTRMTQKAFDFHGLSWDLDGWDTSTTQQIGVQMIRMACDALDLFVIDRKHLRQRGKRTRPPLVILSTPIFDKIVADRHFAFSQITTKWFPMVAKPRPWDESLYGGGYYTSEVVPYGILKGTATRPDAAKHLSAQSSDAMFVSAVNTAQETAWRINDTVLEAADAVYDQGIELGTKGCVPPSELLEFPEMPANYHELKAANPNDPIVRGYKRECFDIRMTNMQRKGRGVTYLQMRGMINEFKGQDEIYFPHQLDFRGRIYSVPSGLSPQGTEISKAVLEFSKGVPLGTEEAVGWLAVSGATNWGLDKASLPERMQWVSDNLGMIESIAADWRTNTDWMKADEPFLFLRFCKDWEGYMQNGLSHVSHTPIAVDATCSGTQHLSALSRDRETAELVNLTASSKRFDIYGVVADRVVEMFERDRKAGHALAAIGLSLGVSRSTVKRGVMVVPYSGTRHAVADYVFSEVRADGNGEALEIEGFPRYLGETVWTAIQEVMAGPCQTMAWLQDCARELAPKGPITWDVPYTGFKVIQDLRRQKEHRIKTFLNGKAVKLTSYQPQEDQDPKSHASALSPNFVHSLDAAHLQMVVNAASEYTKDFALIHDSFGTHAAYMDKFSSDIRKEFVRLHSQDNLAILSRSWFGNEAQSPSLGDFAVEETLANSFFFS